MEMRRHLATSGIACRGSFDSSFDFVGIFAINCCGLQWLGISTVYMCVDSHSQQEQIGNICAVAQLGNLKLTMSGHGQSKRESYHFRAEGAHSTPRKREDTQTACPAVRRPRDRLRPSWRRTGLRRSARVCRWWDGNGGWRGRRFDGGRNSCANEGQGALVPDEARPVFPGGLAGGTASRSGHFLRKRSRGGCSGVDGGGLSVWRSWSCDRGTRPIADDSVAPPASGCREDRHDGDRSQEVEETIRGL